jgi:hypothetical protein
MLCWGKAYQIGNGVVVPVAIFMVDLTSGRDWPVDGLPYFLMKCLISPSRVRDTGAVVALMRLVLGVWIAPIGDTLKCDDFCCHVTIISSPVRESKCT